MSENQFTNNVSEDAQVTSLYVDMVYPKWFLSQIGTVSRGHIGGPNNPVVFLYIYFDCNEMPVERSKIVNEEELSHRRFPIKAFNNTGEEFVLSLPESVNCRLEHYYGLLKDEMLSR